MVDIPDDEGDAAMPKRTVSRLLVGLLGVTAFGSILASCSVEPIPPDPPTGPAVARFFLEIVNESSERARVQVVMFTTYFEIPPKRIDRRSGVIDLESNGKMTFKMVQNHSLDDVWDSLYIRWFKEAHFYDEDTDSPYRSYVYESFDCLGFYCEGPGDDTLVVHWSADGTTEQLFLESPDRPFYLERDTEDPRLGRVVITFVPSADRDPDSSGIAADSRLRADAPSP